MALIRWKPTGRFDTFPRNYYEPWNMFDPEYWGRYGTAEDQERTFSPRSDVFEDENNVYLRVELPGMTREDVNINLNESALRISGERKIDYGDDCHCSEGSYGKFSRTFTVGDRVKVEKIEAKLEKGVLHVTLPKAEQAKPRQIEISATE